MRLLLIFLVLSSLLGCENPVDQRQIDEVAETAEKAMNDVLKKLNDYTPSTDKVKNMTTDELEKLFAWEYKVVEVNKDSSGPELEKQLASLGRQRWECFQVISAGNTLRVVCRRHPETYLRLIPRVFP